MSAPSIAFTVKNYLETERLKVDLSFSTVDLTNAMTQQASFLSHYGEVAAKCSKQVDDLELLIDVAESRIYRQIRDELTEKGEKFSEPYLAKLVTANSHMISLKRSLSVAKQIESNAKTAVEAFRHRRDMLVQQGLLTREETKGQVAIHARQLANEVQENQKARFLERAQKPLETQD